MKSNDRTGPVVAVVRVQVLVAPPGTGGTPGAGRPPGATDVTLSPARLLTPGQKWKFAEKAVQYADQMLQVLVDIALNGESETARILAADKVIDRAMGKAPQHNGRTKAHARGMDQIIVAQASGPPARARAG